METAAEVACEEDARWTGIGSCVTHFASYARKALSGVLSRTVHYYFPDPVNPMLKVQRELKETKDWSKVKVLPPEQQKITLEPYLLECGTNFRMAYDIVRHFPVEIKEGIVENPGDDVFHEAREVSLSGGTLDELVKILSPLPICVRDALIELINLIHQRQDMDSEAVYAAYVHLLHDRPELISSEYRKSA